MALMKMTPWQRALSPARACALRRDALNGFTIGGGVVRITPLA